MARGTVAWTRFHQPQWNAALIRRHVTDELLELMSLYGDVIVGGLWALLRNHTGRTPMAERQAIHRLRARGLAFRVRKDGRRYYQTLKSNDAEGLAAYRGEWQNPLRTAEPNLALDRSPSVDHDAVLARAQPLQHGRPRQGSVAAGAPRGRPSR